MVTSTTSSDAARKAPGLTVREGNGKNRQDRVGVQQGRPGFRQLAVIIEPIPTMPIQLVVNGRVGRITIENDQITAAGGQCDQRQPGKQECILSNNKTRE